MCKAVEHVTNLVDIAKYETGEQKETAEHDFARIKTQVTQCKVDDVTIHIPTYIMLFKR